MGIPLHKIFAFHHNNIYYPPVGKLSRGNRFLTSKNTPASKKFSNARWIYQQIQNKINPESITKQNIEQPPKQTFPKNRNEEKEDEMEFSPLITSTPNKSTFDRSSHNSTAFEDLDYSMEDLGNVQRDAPMSQQNSPSFEFPTSASAMGNNLEPSRVSSKTTQRMDRSSFEWNTNSDSRDHGVQTDQMLSDGNESTKTGDADDQEWSNYFKERVTRNVVGKGTKVKHHRNRDNPRPSSSSSSTNKENVAIKHVRKIVMYVNNY